MSKPSTNDQTDPLWQKPEEAASSRELTDTELEQVAGGVLGDGSVRPQRVGSDLKSKTIGVGELHSQKV